MVSKLAFTHFVSKCDAAIVCVVLQALCLNSTYTYVCSLNKWFEKQLPEQIGVTELVLLREVISPKD